MSKGGTQMTKLYIIKGPMEGKSFDLPGDSFSIGRSSDNEIQINDDSVSRNHLCIRQSQNKYFIKDLISQNGTFIEGRQLKPGIECEVNEGVPFAIGNTLLKFARESRQAKSYWLNLADTDGQAKKINFYKDKRVIDRKTLESFYEISLMLMQTLDYQKICKKIMKSMFQILHRMDNGAILLRNDKTGELDEIISEARGLPQPFNINYSRTIVRRVLKEGRAVLVSDTRKEEEGNLSESIEMMRIRSLICVPLVIQSRTRGVIYVHSVNHPQGFRKDDLYLLTVLSGAASLALENAFEYDKRKQVEEALNRSEKKYRLLIENMNDAIFIVQNRKIVFANQKTVSLLGYSMKELVDMDLIDLFHPKDHREILERFNGETKTEGHRDDPFRLLKKEGSESWVHIHQVPVMWEGVPSLIFFLRDITRDRALEKQISEKQRMASIKSLARGMAHNFNNLLMVIQGHVSLLQLDLTHEDKQYERLISIEKHVELGSSLTSRLLAFSGMGKLSTGVIDVNRQIENTIDQFTGYRELIRFQKRLEPDLWKIKGDPIQIRQILTDLLMNAREAMPQGGDIILQTENISFYKNDLRPDELKRGRYIKITVTDQGMGMDKQTQLRAFDPFFTTKSRTDKVGLGLAAAYGTVQNHDGLINFYSEEGRGTTFQVYLPALEG